MARDGGLERTLAWLLRRLLPSAFHDRWGREIAATIHDRGRDARRQGVTTLALFAVRELLSVAALVATARLRPSKPPAARSDTMLTDPEDTRCYRVAWVVALAVHLIAFMVVFPFGGSALEATPERELTVIQRFEPPKPPEPTKTTTVKKRARAVPIPDPTPDAPEPIVSETETVYVETTGSPDVEFVVEAPTGPPPGPPAQEVSRVGPHVQRPQQLVRVQPEYPELARRARLECTVILETRIGVQGDVLDVEVLRGCGLGLDAAAMRAVEQWRYAPTLVDGRPVEVAMTLTVVFRLQ